MTMQVSETITATGNVALDAPIFDPVAFRLTDEQAGIIAQAREIGQSVFAGRAAKYDREAIFPTENYRDLIVSDCWASLYPRSMAAWARTTRPMLWRLPRSAAIAARPL